MSCNPALVACQISRLVDASSGWDWNGFVSTLIASVVGALVGVGGVYFGFWLQRRQRYSDAIDGCVVEVLAQIAVYASQLRAYEAQQENMSEYKSVGVSYFDRTGEAVIRRPDDFPMSISLDIAQMRARGKDRAILTDAIRAHNNIRHLTDIGLLVQMLGLLGGALSRWRSEIWGVEEVRSSLARIEAASELDDITIPDDEDDEDDDEGGKQ